VSRAPAASAGGGGGGAAVAGGAVTAAVRWYLTASGVGTRQGDGGGQCWWCVRFGHSSSSPHT
jgi:hypothetical protein